MTPLPPRLPDPGRADVTTVTVGSLFTGTAEGQRAALDALRAGVRDAEWPKGLLELSVLASDDGEALLSYGQWSGPAAARVWPGGGGWAELAVPYRIHRGAPAGPDAPSPGCVVTAAFDVDGPERQRHITDALLDAAEGVEPRPGAVSSHFHHSLDGTRVLNWAEWTSPEAHAEAVAGAALDDLYEIITGTPGVRALRGRYYLPADTFIG
ncbi:antibiotic biosynthesis monooxygenase [Allostreptomyces psammosilenae]|uniref:ABM domain-containing protein n=1 Tax=Allostreptomyces psammosilenae TaxID=1892865 RepID=A0A852ZTW9_9ACTN|nr:antibiotic biosynthesis monooxygenase [Allostreptomyces psammosilenae]NYI04730.1 hypothetical protein [Allostreptomyces psammosilenae]